MTSNNMRHSGSWAQAPHYHNPRVSQASSITAGVTSYFSLQWKFICKIRAAEKWAVTADESWHTTPATELSQNQ